MRMTLLYDTQSLLERYMIKLGRNRTLLATNLVTPPFFLILFSQLLTKFGVFLPGVSGGYLAYLAPGVILMNAMIGGPQGAVSIINDLNSGFLSKMLLTQASRSAILLGRLVTDMAISVVQAVITIVFAIALGVQFSTGLPGVLLVLVTVAFFEFALSGIFLAIGMRNRKAETISALSSVVFFPLIFISSMMFPVSFFPSWAQTISSYNPVSYASDVTRGLVSGNLAVGTFVSAYLLIGTIAAVTFAATLYQFRKVVS
jgi:ABC-2 type transport system permease protein